MQTVDRRLETVAHLHLVDHQKIDRAFAVMLVDVGIERVARLERLEFFEPEIDANDVGVLDASRQIFAKRVEQFGFAGSAHARDDLDVRGADHILELVQIQFALNYFHIIPRLKYSSFRKFCQIRFLRNENFFVGIGEKALCYLMFLRAMMTMREKSFRKNRNFSFLRNENTSESALPPPQ